MTKAKLMLHHAHNRLTFPLVHQSVASSGAARGSLLVMPTVTRLVCEGKGEKRILCHVSHVMYVKQTIFQV